jgi:hypothetical protein
MKTNLRLLFFLIVISASISGISQNVSKKLPQFLFPEFQNGIVKLKNGNSYTAPLNYNLVDEELIFFQNGVYRTPDKPEEIDTAIIKNIKLVPVNKMFYEVLTKGTVTMFIQHKSKYTSVGTATAYGLTSQTNAPLTITTVRTGNQVRNLEMPDNVQVTASNLYWVRIKDEYSKFTSERQFLKIFPQYESELKGYIKQNKIDIKNSDDLIRLGHFCNQLVK